ncbi:putative membrane protein [Leifsonia sp. AK011]|uniref:SHOCT domain-containing protein n=1 Tax=Leifsonia sp. AK011 TaxID=2723075 RepID=UPI0015C79565|nr:SHOCT domain-containing protein [Leifsonia sp. AK011]NYF10483.1 putative membrane protein [Leifsonia sp. AK011]
MDLWTFLWNTFLIFAFVVYLMILITIFTDLFRDRALNGWYKALWIIALLVFPYLSAFIYLIARGRGMAERQHEFAKASNDAATAYIRQAAGSGPASDIAAAKALLDDGTITAEEYEALKKKALA